MNQIRGAMSCIWLLVGLATLLGCQAEAPQPGANEPPALTILNVSYDPPVNFIVNSMSSLHLTGKARQVNRSRLINRTVVVENRREQLSMVLRRM